MQVKLSLYCIVERKKCHKRYITISVFAVLVKKILRIFNICLQSQQKVLEYNQVDVATIVVVTQ